VQNGWKQFAWFVLDNRDREHSQCVVSPGTMRTIHTTLFGGAGRPLAARIALKDTARLLLASVGIPFEIAEATGVDDGYDDEKYSSSSRLSLGRHAPGVSAARLRKVCGLAPLPGDNGMSSPFQVKDQPLSIVYRQPTLLLGECKSRSPPMMSRRIMMMMRRRRRNGSTARRA
jgi:hypothetical protein